MVEQVAGIVNRVQTKSEDDADEEDVLELQFEKAINEFKVYPYRAGYEREDSELIQQKLRDGNLNGIISTSALELGIDIATLDLGILLGIPYSSTSFYQRIGRVGRVGCKRDGLIIIINDNSVGRQQFLKTPRNCLTFRWQKAPYILKMRIFNTFMHFALLSQMVNMIMFLFQMMIL